MEWYAFRFLKWRIDEHRTDLSEPIAGETPRPRLEFMERIQLRRRRGEDLDRGE
jgi:hypothetical protein